MVAAALSYTSAVAGERSDWPRSLFDRPAKVQTIKGGAGTDPPPEVICTFYADVMVREQGTDSPSPDAASLVPAGAHTARPLCNRKVPVGAVGLGTADFGFVGRNGPFLFFEAADPNGAVPFKIIDAGTGRTLMTDGTKAGSLKWLSSAADGIRLRFTRGVNGSCSIVADGTTCWAKMARGGEIPDSLGQAPPIEACAAAYRKAKTPASDPSLLFYEVEVTLQRDGKATALPSGSIGCEPMP